MINKFRSNYIVTNMIIVSVILISTFTYLYFSSAYTFKTSSYKVLAAVSDRLANTTITTQDNPQQRKEGLSIFSFIITANNELIPEIGENFYSDDEILQIAEIIDSKNQSQGELPSLNIRYSVKYNAEKYYSLLDTTHEKKALLSLAINLSIICLLTHILFLIVSIRLSKVITAPVINAWDDQRQFISNASHELKTPLTIILANTELLESSEDKNTDKNLIRLNYVHLEANKMKKLVEELLFLARSDEYVGNIEFRNINISNIITQNALMFEPIAFEKKIQLEFDIKKGLYISCVKEQIEQLSIILLDNAIKYTEKNNVISVKLYDNKKQVVLKVNNTGSYIEPNIKDNIFKRFYKKNKSRNSNQNSYGLGLSIAKKICDTHNAEISVQSNKENGTTFTVTF